MRWIGEPQDMWESHEIVILPLQCFRQLSHVYSTCGLVHTPLSMCPTSKKCLYAVHLTHTLWTLKAQLYFLWSQWHPLYFWCPSWDCRVFVFIVSHFRDHLLDLLSWRVLSWDLCGLCGFPLQSFHLGLFYGIQSRFFIEPQHNFVFFLKLLDSILHYSNLLLCSLKWAKAKIRRISAKYQLYNILTDCLSLFFVSN